MITEPFQVDDDPDHSPAMELCPNATVVSTWFLSERTGPEPAVDPRSRFLWAADLSAVPTPVPVDDAADIPDVDRKTAAGSAGARRHRGAGVGLIRPRSGADPRRSAPVRCG